MKRHVGDLGNIFTNSDALPTEVLIHDKMISLDPNSKANILGLAVVVHSGKDDLGKGGDTGSLKTGNAGSRVACGVIKAQWRQLTNLIITNQIINNVENWNEFSNILPLSGMMAYMFLISELFD